MNERRHVRPPLGLGDLVRAVAALGLDEEGAMRAAAAMGLRAAPPPEEPASQRLPEGALVSKRQRPPPIAPLPELEASPPPLSGQDGAMLTLEPLGSSTDALPAFLTSARPLEDADLAETHALPALDPLLEPAWQRSLLGALLATETPDGPIDAERLVDLASRVRLPEKLPRRPRWTLRRGAQVLVDEGVAMMPFAGDVAQICAALLRLTGGAPVEILRFEETPFFTTGADGDNRPHTPPPRGTPIIALTDLGVRDPGRAAEWLRFGQTARRAGCPLIALVPYPKARWPRSLSRSIAIASWDRRTRVGAVRRTARAAARGAP